MTDRGQLDGTYFIATVAFAVAWTVGTFILAGQGVPFSVAAGAVAVALVTWLAVTRYLIARRTNREPTSDTDHA